MSQAWFILFRRLRLKPPGFVSVHHVVIELNIDPIVSFCLIPVAHCSGKSSKVGSVVKVIVRFKVVCNQSAQERSFGGVIYGFEFCECDILESGGS